MNDFYGMPGSALEELDMRPEPASQPEYIAGQKFSTGIIRPIEPIHEDEFISRSIDILARHANGNHADLDSAIHYLTQGDNKTSAEMFASMAHYYADDEAALALGLAYRLDPENGNYLQSLFNLDRKQIYTPGLWNLSEE